MLGGLGSIDGRVPAREPPSIWWWALGYFACYAPYTALTKAVTKGMVVTASGGSRTPCAMPGEAGICAGVAGMAPPTGMELLPITVVAAVIAAFTFLAVTGWWRYATPVMIAGRRVPRPTLPTILSGLCSAGIIATTTLAYTFNGVSILFVMLMMRGGVLVIAPMVDIVARRRVRWFSWLGLGLSLASVAMVMLDGGSLLVTLACAIDVMLYLGCYFIRLNLMTQLAKSPDQATTLRYFVEEQLVSSPALLVGLAIAAIAGHPELRAGFTSFFERPIVLHGLTIGLLSQGTGIFGGLVLLDRRENTFSVPVNRASSILAGVVASVGLWLLLGAAQPGHSELLGAGLIIAAILALTVPPALEKRRRRRSGSGSG